MMESKTFTGSVWIAAIATLSILEGGCLASELQTGDGKPCHIPFTYKGQEYHNCTLMDSDRPWCGLTANVDRDNSTGFCDDDGYSHVTMAPSIWTTDVEDLSSSSEPVMINITLKDFGTGAACAYRFYDWFVKGIVQANFPGAVMFDRFCFCYGMGCRPGLIPEEEDFDAEKIATGVLKEINDDLEDAARKHFFIRIHKNIPVLILYSSIFLFGAAGNLLVIVTVFRYMNRSSVTNTFICNMTVADLCVCVLCVPIMAFNEVYSDFFFPGGLTICRCTEYLSYVSFIVSIFSMTVMGIERYLAICWPMQVASINTKPRIRMLLCLVWFLALLLSTPIGVFSNITYGTCDAPYNGQETIYPWISQAIYFVLIPLIFLLPLLVQAVCYGLATRALLQSIQVASSLTAPDPSKKAGGENAGSKGKEETKKDKSSSDAQGRIQVIKMLISILVVFFICWTPLMAGIFVIQFDSSLVQNHQYQYSMIAAKMLAALQSAVNPAFYAVFSKQFRMYFGKLLCPYMHKKAQTGSVSGLSQTASTAVSSSSGAISNGATA